MWGEKMSVEIIEEQKSVTSGIFLPPTVLAVKKSAESGLLLSMGIIICIALSVLSICDFSAGVILLPLAFLLLIAHIVAFNKSRRSGGNYGLSFLGISYILPLLIECAFSIWEEVFDNKFIAPLFQKLKLITLDLPHPLDNIINRTNFDMRLIFSVLVLVFWCMALIMITLVTSKRQNMPSTSLPMICFIALLLITVAVLFGAVYSAMMGYFPQYILTSFIYKPLPYIFAGVIGIIGIYLILACIYVMKIFIKMKKVKNVIQK